jgi:glycopeptide antibiotics resistance protein
MSLISSRAARGWLPIYLLALGALLVPWGDIKDHTHWQKVVWIPFAAPIRPFDIVANVLLFVPFGALWRRAAFRSRLLGPATALLLGASLSLGAEALQLYSHWRFPSATDVAMNVAGLVVGLWCGRRAE